jgi:ABC-type branched-subunit amino acid transport system ATPase component
VTDADRLARAHALLGSGPEPSSAPVPAGLRLALGSLFAAGVSGPLSWLLVAREHLAEAASLEANAVDDRALMLLAIAVLTAAIVPLVLGRRFPVVRLAGSSLAAVASLALLANPDGGSLTLAAGLGGLGLGTAGATLRSVLVDRAAPRARLAVLRASATGSVLSLAVAAAAVASGVEAVGLLVLSGVAVAGATLALRDGGAAPAADELAIRELVTEEPSADEVPGRRQMARRLFARRSVVSAAWASGVMGLVLYPLPLLLLFHLEDRFELATSQRALVLTLIGVVACNAPALGAHLTSRSFRRDPGGPATHAAHLLTAGAVATLVVALAPIVALAALAAVLAFAAVWGAQGRADAVLFTSLPAALRPWAAGLTTAAQGLGALVGLAVLAGVDQRFGTGWAISVAGFGLFAGVPALRGLADAAAGDLTNTIDEILGGEDIARRRREGTKVPLLECRGVDFAYGQVQVLFGVDFAVDDGEMVALLGTNGAGKSTLLRVISGLGLPSAGTVRLDGDDISFVSPADRVRAGITQVPGGKAVFGPMSVVENLRVYGYALGNDRAAVDRGIETAFEVFPRLAERRNQTSQTLSGGEQQMLALSKALILEPRLLLIDELSLGLAPRIVAQLLEMVREINRRGTAVVLVEQSVNVALSLADHAYYLEKGEVRFDGATADLLERPDVLRSVYLKGAAEGLGGSS